jgi:hypothetical protein
MAGGTRARPAEPAAEGVRAPSGAWRPIAKGELAERLAAALREIAAAVDGAAPEQLPEGAPPAYQALQRVNLSSGAAGIALLHAELAAATGDQREAERARALAADSAAALAEITMGPALLGGFTGLAWAVEAVERRLGAEAGDLADEIDEALADYVAGGPWRGEYDLVSGLVGFAAYALDRLPAPGAERLLVSLADRLAELALPVGDGLAWRTPPERLPPHQLAAFPGGCWNVGLAHGVPGVVAVLAGMLDAAIQADRTREVLAGAVRWLLAQRLEGCPAFPSMVDGAAGQNPSRLAWCYGDPGIAIALYRAGVALGDAAVVGAALDIARRAAEMPRQGSGVVDAGICHGAAGLAHIFNRLHQATGEELFADAARRWLATTLDLRRPGEPVAGFAAWQAVPEPHWSPTPGLLSGAAGVGAVFAAAIHDLEPVWDSCLLLDLPSGA